MAIAVEAVPTRLYTNTAHRIDLIFWETKEKKTRHDLTGATVEVFIVDGANVRKYTATIDDADEGEAHIDLNASYHSSAGSVACQVHEDSVCKAEYTLTFYAKLAEV